ncbi:acyl-CoA dehydrogenase [Sulfodiicoccus acidiphilus]|uniref:Acyl-CoA dehydrogenase n=1 Tax=Sulfodiicoccus acidiphilus TaxID=1670455 RepID=A0A348B0B0_9CREN|nr:acyl-CoA dehydrogenase family protein [Sulfodiicoccus acidiphilus]BBD71612.1 acyl-CoA dehydrogenase [Sulfodiicoccus acidiphilus]GGT87094.1 acyl-CoA dehydrogenase [Sulfodiicoccus acidiphilus]
MLIKDTYLDEETSLILSSLDQTLKKFWSTKELRKYRTGDFSQARVLANSLAELEMFRYMIEATPRTAAEMHMLVGANLLPGILSSTLLALRAITDNVVREEIALKSPRAAISSFNIVPAADEADYVIVGESLARRDDVLLSVMESLDPTMKLCKVTFKRSQLSPWNRDELGLGVASQLVGHAEEALRMTIEYSRVRKAFDRPIGSFQAIKHRLVDDAISLELVKSLVLKATEDKSMTEAALFLAMKKVPKIITDSIQTYGGMGFTDDVDLHLHLRRALTLTKIAEPMVGKILDNFRMQHKYDIH